MSFLLDALGKADDDRRRSEVPELRTYNQGRGSPLRGAVRGFALLCLLLLFFALGYFLRPYLETTRFGQSLDDLSSAPPQAISEPVSRPVSSQPEQLATPNNTTPAVKDPVFSLEVISYSDSPTVRFVMINGSVIREGEVLDTGETLLLIEPDAVVLEKAGRQIRVGL